MEYIEINGFLTIDHAHFEIKKINILIGAQAQGKSVIAKLVYLFKKCFMDIFIESIKKIEVKSDIDKKCLAEFEKYFPSYSWSNQEFSIVYHYKVYDVSITRIKVDNEYTLKFNYCNNLADFFQGCQNRYQNYFNTHTNETKPTVEDMYGLRFQEIYDSVFIRGLKDSIFIPANRSFFANIQKNIFSFLANNIEIDQFIKIFGSSYEQSKRHHQLEKHQGYNSNDVTRKKVDKLFSNIVVGEYVYADEQDWILNNGKQTNLSNASSGQQESLPMLLVLKYLTFNNYEKQPTTFFIEEPEAHLFPTSQKQIISLIATIYNAFGHSFFITTHSPYILTAINNLVVGQDAYDKANGDTEKLKRLEKVLPTNELIRLEDVSAYTLNKGKLESIINIENRLIGANLLDSVSDEFEAAFGVAIEILYGDD
ncbi:MAG: hypothetical protein RIQ94_2981 [Pseudomonadota bacterium]|jgi:predicted ATPase